MTERKQLRWFLSLFWVAEGVSGECDCVGFALFFPALCLHDILSLMDLPICTFFFFCFADAETLSFDCFKVDELL